MLNWVDQLMEDPLSVMAPRIKGGGPRRAWDAKEDENALNLRMDTPGLSKDVKVTVEQNTLIVKGQASSEEEAAESGGRSMSAAWTCPPTCTSWTPSRRR